MASDDLDLLSSGGQPSLLPSPDSTHSIQNFHDQPVSGSSQEEEEGSPTQASELAAPSAGTVTSSVGEDETPVHEISSCDSPKPVNEGAEDREEEAATDDSVVEQQAARNSLRYLQYLRLLCGRQDPLAYHSATITFNEWMENGSSLDFFTDNETSPGGTNDTDNEEEEAEEEANDETEEQRIGVRGPIEESEDPDAWIEWHYDPMDVDEEEEYFRETGAEADDEADGTEEHEEHEEQDDKENVDPEE